MVMDFKSFLREIHDDASDWSRGKNGWARVPLLIWFGIVFVKSLRDPLYGSILSPLNLGIHELGHLIFAYCGTFLQVLAGSLVECLAPLYGVYNFYRQRDYFAAALCFGWLSTAYFNVATYAGDARSMSLPLVTPFGADPVVAHDWNYLLGCFGILPLDWLVAGLFRLLAVASMMICLVFGGWLVFNMTKPLKSQGGC